MGTIVRHCGHCFSDSDCDKLGTMSTELHCPECGHLIGTIRSANERSIDDPGSAYMQSVIGLTQRFLDDATKPVPGDRVNSTDFVACYYQWLANMTSDSDVSRQALGTALRILGVAQRRSNGVRYYQDIALR